MIADRKRTSPSVMRRVHCHAISGSFAKRHSLVNYFMSIVSYERNNVEMEDFRLLAMILAHAVRTLSIYAKH
jgi:hypothetical protein